MKNFRRGNRGTGEPNTPNVRSMLLQIIFCLVCGVLLILFGKLALRITAYVLSGVLILCGAISVIAYIRSKPEQRILEAKLATGLILLIAGILLAFNPDYLKDILPFVWGLAMLFGAFLKIQYAFDEKSVKVAKWWIMLIFAAFSMIIGILSLLNPDFLGENRNLIIGILLVAEAILNIVVYFLLKNALKKHLENTAPAAAAEAPAEAPAPAETNGETEPEAEPETEA